MQKEKGRYVSWHRLPLVKREDVNEANFKHLRSDKVNPRHRRLIMYRMMSYVLVRLTPLYFRVCFCFLALGWKWE